MRSFVIAILSVVSLYTGFYYGASYNNEQVVALKEDLKLKGLLYDLTKSALDLCIARADVESYIFETGIDPILKLGEEEQLLLTSKVAGEITFKANCAICHGASGEGKVGPDIRYSSLELLNLKVLEGRYPEGYKPQRNTHMMPRFPHLYPKLPDVLEYLKSKR